MRIVELHSMSKELVAMRDLVRDKYGIAVIGYYQWKLVKGGARPSPFEALETFFALSVDEQEAIAEEHEYRIKYGRTRDET